MDDDALLVAFDRDSRFGPTSGVKRMERYLRAVDLGLAPPPAVHAVLSRLPLHDPAQWSGAFGTGVVRAGRSPVATATPQSAQSRGASGR